MRFGVRHGRQIEAHMQAAPMPRPVGVKYDPGNLSMNSIDCISLHVVNAGRR
ncbi:hypothetical protein Pmar_PMAR009778 [Perkinsus marinus ATCC 50983]|uniref:Uncharacterized protein n=1 Tax=Perkinsus marinus (strain ATCC 50983 / TXsc) TaxID=423536 RepID=C5LPH0_PERM5|nr:hypothetical protein Pmar_PMAR009778 [Perkinsus marinus ATCC 50983]EER01379.1 hypothetical protein Pmar_PMAR009778 [Perkinsus marinus ATCC 50983]|eukprot:XP_002768661.1 hypothetical protein Pmar_PMAR009778 [Perkinsus marinus ATCC 50983]